VEGQDEREPLVQESFLRRLGAGVCEGPRTQRVEGGGRRRLRTARVERGGGGTSTYTTCSRGRSAKRPSIEESVRGISRFLHGWRGEGSEWGALEKRTAIRERGSAVV
jgi:hypothetical protein